MSVLHPLDRPTDVAANEEEVTEVTRDSRVGWRQNDCALFTEFPDSLLNRREVAPEAPRHGDVGHAVGFAPEDCRARGPGATVTRQGELASHRRPAFIASFLLDLGVPARRSSCRM